MPEVDVNVCSIKSFIVYRNVEGSVVVVHLEMMLHLLGTPACSLVSVNDPKLPPLDTTLNTTLGKFMNIDKLLGQLFRPLYRSSL